MKVWKFTLWSDPFVRVFKYLDEKVPKSYVSWHWKTDAKFEEKLTYGSKNDWKNLVNFKAISGKSKDLHFDVLLLSIAYKVSAEKAQKNYLSWHWKKILTLKKTDFLFEKWHEEFGEI